MVTAWFETASCFPLRLHLWCRNLLFPCLSPPFNEDVSVLCGLGDTPCSISVSVTVPSTACILSMNTHADRP